MERIMSSPSYALSRAIGAGAAAAIAVYASIRDKRVAGMTPVVWMQLSILSALGVVLHLLTKILHVLEALQAD